jgi:hypothetical protein
MKNYLIAGLFLFFMLMHSSLFAQTSFIPEDGLVPNKETAIKIAEAIWLPIYGKSIKKSKPFVAKLKDNEVWIVEGTLKRGFSGGVPYIEINKADGKIIRVIHTK